MAPRKRKRSAKPARRARSIKSRANPVSIPSEHRPYAFFRRIKSFLLLGLIGVVVYVIVVHSGWVLPVNDGQTKTTDETTAANGGKQQSPVDKQNDVEIPTTGGSQDVPSSGFPVWAILLIVVSVLFGAYRFWPGRTEDIEEEEADDTPEPATPKERRRVFELDPEYFADVHPYVELKEKLNKQLDKKIRALQAELRGGPGKNKAKTINAELGHLASIKKYFRRYLDDPQDPNDANNGKTTDPEKKYLFEKYTAFREKGLKAKLEGNMRILIKEYNGRKRILDTYNAYKPRNGGFA